jgi:hypothetical protein
MWKISMFPAKQKTSQHTVDPGPALEQLKALQSPFPFEQIENRKQRDVKEAIPCKLSPSNRGRPVSLIGTL